MVTVDNTPLAPVKGVYENIKQGLGFDRDKQAREACQAKGGRWDANTRSCIMPPPQQTTTETKNTGQPQERLKPTLTNPEVFTDKSGRPSGITLPDGRTFLGLNQNDVNKIAQKDIQSRQLPEGTAPVGTAQNQLDAAMEAQALQGQVGQFDQLGLSNDPLLNQEQALRQGIVGAIPRALSLAVTGAGVGLAGGAVAGGGVGTPITAPTGAAIGAVAGFVGGISSSMISEYRGQRRDTINAQKRVLDEGKQTMKDWATLAEADPANKAFYLSQYNAVAAQIDQAYRQMKLDTNRDIAKFETALPDLAEFEAFYAAGGEKDTLDQEMRNSLLVPSSPEYKMLELTQRRAQ